MTNIIKYIAAAAGAVVLAGCVCPRAPLDNGYSLVNIGEKAADIDRAVAVNRRQEALQIEAMRQDLGRMQHELLQDAWIYGNASADSWSDQRIARRDRASVAGEYAVWYNQRIVESSRCAHLRSTYHGSITLVESYRATTMRDASTFDGVKALQPQ